MEIEVKFTSKELIKPSSPTPHHLRKLEFSFIDQNQFPISMPFVLFYAKSDSLSNQQRSDLLKRSLSKALTIFYPLAGRINNYSYADCNDEGALFIQAKANCTLSYILRNRNQYHNHTYKLFPSQPHKGIHQLGSLFQITFFDCGGFALAFAMPHMLGDALSMFVFLNDWAAVARGHTLESVTFGTHSVFPPIKTAQFDLKQMVFKDNVVTKSFVFDKSTLSSLRERYRADGKKLSRVIALQVFILNRLVAATHRSKDTVCMAINSVNVRQLVDPPVSKESFGNLVWVAPAMIENMGSIRKPLEFYKIGRRIQEAIASVNAESIRKVQKGELNLDKGVMESLKGEMVRYSLASLCNFPMYGVDFGWGKPEWIATCGLFFDNFVLFFDTKDGHGIEAWISLTQEDMAKFESDELLLSHVSSTPNSISRL